MRARNVSLAALAALTAPASAVYTLYKFDAVNAFKAYSLDGSPGAFMFSPGSGANANDWIIYHQYGGWCYSIDGERAYVAKDRRRKRAL